MGGGRERTDVLSENGPDEAGAKGAPYFPLTKWYSQLAAQKPLFYARY